MYANATVTAGEAILKKAFVWIAGTHAKQFRLPVGGYVKLGLPRSAQTNGYLDGKFQATLLASGAIVCVAAPAATTTRYKYEAPSLKIKIHFWLV